MFLKLRNRLLGGTSPYVLSIEADGTNADIGGGGGQSDIVERTAGGEGPISARDAARSLMDARFKSAAGERRQDEEQQGEARQDATAQESASHEADTAQETGPGETQGADAEAEKLPPIEPPRSWTKEDKELFKGLPRETQERLADRERSRESDFLKRQNAAAEQSKSLKDKETAAEQVRAQYEGALPMLLQALQEQQQGEFADIKSVEDVRRMAREDWPRYVQWDAQQKTVAAVAQQVQQAEQRQTQEKQLKFTNFVKEQNALFAEKAPELSDPKAKSAAADAAVGILKDLGWSEEELGKLWRGESEISLHDHRFQLMLRDGVRYRQAQAAAKKPAPKPVPQVQRPGPAPERTVDADGRIKDLTERFNATGNPRDAAALLAARRAARH